jgi:hypothetical protein
MITHLRQSEDLLEFINERVMNHYFGEWLNERKKRIKSWRQS